MQPTNSPKADNQIIDKAIWVAKECLSPRASQYDESTSTDVEPSPNLNSWDITSTIEVESQYNPTILLNQLD